MTPDPDWRADAACKQRPDLFFPPVVEGKGTAIGPPWDPAPALAVCAGCPVVKQCRAWAEHTGDIVDGVAIHGVIGGVGMAKVGRPGPIVTMPCGTNAAYARHKRNGEEPCEACYSANVVRWRADKQRLRHLRGVG